MFYVIQEQECLLSEDILQHSVHQIPIFRVFQPFHQEKCRLWVDLVQYMIHGEGMLRLYNIRILISYRYYFHSLLLFFYHFLSILLKK